MLVMSWIGKVLGKEDDSNLDYSSEERKIFAASFRIGWTIILFGAGGLATIALWAWGIRGGTANVHVAAFIGADLLVAGGGAPAGAPLCFFFLVPRPPPPGKPGGCRYRDLAWRLRSGIDCPHVCQHESRADIGLADDPVDRRHPGSNQGDRRLGRGARQRPV